VELESAWLLLPTADVVNDPGHSEADQTNDCQTIIQILEGPCFNGLHNLEQRLEAQMKP
jgi:hypothetical protein